MAIASRSCGTARAVAAVCGLLALAGTARAAEALTLVTWNVANYLGMDRVTPDGFRPDYPKPETEKTAVRAVLRAIDADVVALQELGPEPYLLELQRDLRSEGLDYPYRAYVAAADAERHVALLSRRPFAAVRAHTDLEFRHGDGRERVRRGLLEVRLAPAPETAASAAAGDAPGEGAGGLTVFVLHLKSRYTERDDDPEAARQRAGEAVAIRDRILELFPDPAAACFVVLGDCNDLQTSRPLRALAARGETEIARLVPAADDRGDTWTYQHRQSARYDRIDYALVSPGLWPRVAGGIAHIYDVPAVRAASDHRPVVVRLAWE